MLRLLIDQDLDHVILRGLLLRVPKLDVVTANQAGLGDASDPDLLAWAAEQKRVVVSHDRRTMPVMRQLGSLEAKRLPASLLCPGGSP
jgi:predicted nuclease of predicted toxin-antitoxin system